MATVRRLPTRSEVFIDARSGERALRVTHHLDEGVLVLSIWHGGTCAATIQLPIEEAPRLVTLLATGLADQLGPVERDVAAVAETR